MVENLTIFWILLLPPTSSLYFFSSSFRELRPLVSYHSELIWNCESYRQSVDPLDGNQTVARPLPTQDNTNTKETQTFMPRVGFEPTIPVIERAKKYSVLDHAATVIGHFFCLMSKRPPQKRSQMNAYRVCHFNRNTHYKNMSVFARLMSSSTFPCQCKSC
jgi:hypothetical protein